MNTRLAAAALPVTLGQALEKRWISPYVELIHVIKSLNLINRITKSESWGNYNFE